MDTAIQLVGKDIIMEWIQMPVANSQKSKDGRGRKPGAAPDDKRCHWSLQDGSLCKNAMREGSAFCKTHASRAAALGINDDSSASAASAVVETDANASSVAAAAETDAIDEIDV
jgi:hypothetical protein